MRFVSSHPPEHVRPQPRPRQRTLHCGLPWPGPLPTDPSGRRLHKGYRTGIPGPPWLSDIASIAVSELLRELLSVPTRFASGPSHLPVPHCFDSPEHKCPPSLRTGCAVLRLDTTTGFSGFSPSLQDLAFRACTGSCRTLRPSTGGDLPVYPSNTSRHADRADAAGALNHRTCCLWMVPISLHRTISDSALRFYFFRRSLDVVHLRFGLPVQSTSCLRPRLTAAAWMPSSVVNSLIRRVGLSPTPLLVSPAHNSEMRPLFLGSSTPFSRLLREAVQSESQTFCLDHYLGVNSCQNRSPY